MQNYALSSYDEFVFFRPKPDGEIDPSGEVGWFLQRERERKRETLEQASQATGVHPHHLDALENGDMTRMPARMEALRMVGLYGQYLGFDPEPLVLHYAKFLPKTKKGGGNSKPGVPSPFGSAKIISFDFARRLYALSAPMKTGFLSLMGVILVVLGVSHVMSPRPQEGSQETALVLAQKAPSNVTEERSASQEEPASLAYAQEDTPKTKESVTATSSMSKPSEQSHQEAPVSSEDPLVALLTQEPPASPKPAPQSGTFYGAENKDSHVMLIAKGSVWVRIEDTNGRLIFSETLRAGDQYRVPNTPGLVAISRDGGLVSYAVDGVEKGVLGQPGEILIGKSLDRDKLS